MKKDFSQISDELLKAKAKEIIKEKNLAQLSNGKLEAIFKAVYFVKDSDLFQPPFRRGFSEVYNILDKKGHFVFGFSSKKNNARSKTVLLLELLNTFVTPNDGFE